MRNRLKCEDGQVLIEFVLVIPILLVILFGVLDLGNVSMSKYKLQGVAYESARYCEEYTGTDLDQDLQSFIYDALDGATVYKGISPEHAAPGTAYYLLETNSTRTKVTITYHEQCMTYVTQLYKGSSFPITVSAVCVHTT